MQTFEDIAGEALDRLYATSLFLSAGSTRRAEDRVVATVAHAAARWFDGLEDDPALWLEDQLVRRFLDEEATATDPAARPAAPSRQRARELTALPSGELPPERLYRAAAGVPPAARAAIWLVQFRRRSYADAAEAIGVGRADLVRMLRFRDAFLAELFRADPGVAPGARRA